MLDAAFPDTPVLLTRVDGHAVWANSEALRRAGVSSRTREPPGGRIVRRKDGEPTGVLVDNAIDLVEAKIPAPTDEQLEHRMIAALRRAAEVGLTKAEVRELSAAMRLPTADKPASPCLASRFAYGVRVTPEGLRSKARTKTLTVPRQVAMYLARDMLGMQLVDGRDYTEHDVRPPGEEPGPFRMAIVNETFVRRLMPELQSMDQAVGKRFSFGGPERPFRRIVGVAKDGKYFNIAEDPRAFVWRPMSQDYSSNGILVVRTKGSPEPLFGPVRSQVQSLDPNMPLFDVKTLNVHMKLALFPPPLPSSRTSRSSRRALDSSAAT